MLTYNKLLVKEKNVHMKYIINHERFFMQLIIKLFNENNIYSHIGTILIHVYVLKTI